MLNIALNTTFEVECRPLFRAFVVHRNIDSLREVGLVTEVINDPLVIKFHRFLENGRIRIKHNGSTGRTGSLAKFLERHRSGATLEFKVVKFAFLYYFGNQFGRKRVHDA